MNAAELEQVLQGGRETQGLDFKASCEWNVQLFVKDILAMANYDDGGLIVIGVDDGTMTRVGVPPAQKATYDIDVMRDQVAAFADPFVDFQIEFVRDLAGLEFGIISIRSFEEVPVICRKNGTDVQPGRVYHRPPGGRAQSAPIAGAGELRQLLELAIARRRRRLISTGLIDAGPAADSVAQLLDAELDDL